MAVRFKLAQGKAPAMLDRPCGARPLKHDSRGKFSLSNEARNSGDYLSIRVVMRVRKVNQTEEFAYALFKGQNEPCGCIVQRKRYSLNSCPDG